MQNNANNYKKNSLISGMMEAYPTLHVWWPYIWTETAFENSSKSTNNDVFVSIQQVQSLGLLAVSIHAH